MLMVEERELIIDELLLTDADYPEEYKNMAHPDDYKIIDKPIPIKYTYHKKPHHNRLILRISWKLKNDEYMAMSFVCDTGAPMYFYLSDNGKELLKQYGRLKIDELQTEYVEIEGRKAMIQETPQIHKPGNIIGLLMLSRLGLDLTDESFKFKKDIQYF